METTRNRATPKGEVDSLNSRSRIALYGGSFDPVHRGHLEIARYCAGVVGLDEVFFIPASRSPLKGWEPIASDVMRLEMLKIACALDDRLTVSDYELKKGGTSYSIETARFFAKEYPLSTIYWILGADQFEQLDQWHGIEELIELVEFLVISRKGSDLSSEHLEFPVRYTHIETPIFPESSSDIRQLAHQSEAIGNLVPVEVEAFIRKRHLYT